MAPEDFSAPATSDSSASVIFAIAETTTAWRVLRLASRMSATRRKHSASAMLVPPNLWTSQGLCAIGSVS